MHVDRELPEYPRCSVCGGRLHAWERGPECDKCKRDMLIVVARVLHEVGDRR